jgi:hypothetical protein
VVSAVDDLDALVPPLAGTVTLAGRRVPIPPLTLARFAAGRRFARMFVTCLAAEDVLDAVEGVRGELAAAFVAATGIDAAELDAADAAEAFDAFFALTRAVRDFSAGPLAAALIGGL